MGNIFTRTTETAPEGLFDRRGNLRTVEHDFYRTPIRGCFYKFFPCLW